MKLLVASVMLLSACGPIEVTACTSKCGMYMPTLPAGWKCDDFQRAEDVTLKHFKSTSLDPRLDTCGGLDKYSVNVNRGHTSWVDAWGRDVSGLCDCFLNKIVIGDSDLANSSLPHEMAHALQDCTPRGPRSENEDPHDNWGRDMIYKAIQQIQWDL